VADPGWHRWGRGIGTGGPGRPENLNGSYFVRPTVFARVREYGKRALDDFTEIKAVIACQAA
jgi:hypothetical protein